MSGYNGRKGPNVSQYVADLNTIPTTQDRALQEQGHSFLDDDVLSFMNAEFIDWDSLGMPDIPALPNVDYDPVAENQARRQNASAFKGNAQSNEFVNNDFQFTDFTSFSPIPTDPSLTGLNVDTSPSQPQHFPLQQQQTTSPTTTSPQNTSTPSASNTAHHTGDKRKHDSISAAISPVGPEEAARFAAEEDKRRRNTAASARFRVKKKQREQALEKTAKEMTEKVGVLETKVTQLEMENKWLKSLITEKSGGEELVGKGVREMYEKFTRENKERQGKERTDGVGTGLKAEA